MRDCKHNAESVTDYGVRGRVSAKVQLYGCDVSALKCVFTSELDSCKGSA